MSRSSASMLAFGIGFSFLHMCHMGDMWGRVSLAVKAESERMEGGSAMLSIRSSAPMGGRKGVQREEPLGAHGL